MSDKIKYTFSTGLEVSGTLEEIDAIAKSLKLKLDYTVIGKVPKGYYPSESKGLTKISEMNAHWLRRAILKRAKDYFAEIYNPEDTVIVFLNKFIGLSDDQIINDLFTEIKSRG